MSRIVFATWDGGGNVPPALALASELQTRGHDVLVMGHRGQQGAVEGRGLAFVPYRAARDFVGAHGTKPVALASTWGDAPMGEEVAATAADAYVVDCLLFGVMRSLAAGSKPYVVLEHMYQSQLVKLATKTPMALAMRLRGIRPMELVEKAELRLLATLPDLDPVSAPNVVQTGPFTSGVTARASDPTILLSLSTFGYRNMDRTWQRALDAVAELPVTVIATTGPAIDPESLRPGSNTEIHSWLPHPEIMPRASMVLGHGGHATTMLALAHDLPLVIVPAFRLGDQPRVATSIAGAGAGLALPASAKTSALRQAAESVLADDGFRASAARLGARIRELSGVSGAATCVEGRVLTHMR